MTYIINADVRPCPTPIRGSYYLTQPRKPWLVNGMIREGTTVFLSGKEGTGKSFVALDLAYSVAEGRPFLGEDVNKGDVLYVAAERGDAQRERLEALRDLKGFNPDSVTFLDYAFMFNRPDDVRLFHEAVERVGITPKLIIIDTLRASFEGDENNSWTAQATMNALRDVRRTYDATMLIIHHVNAFGRSRGSSAFIGAADTELYLVESKSKKAQRVYLTVRKQNNGKKWVQYTLEAQEIAFGNDYSSIVFNCVEASDVELSPKEEEERPRESNILLILESCGEVISLTRLQKELQKLEGSLPNKDDLKKDLERLAQEELIEFDTSGGKFKIGLRPS